MTQSQVNEMGRIERRISSLHEHLSEEVSGSTMDLIKDLVALEVQLLKMKYATI